MFRTRGFGHMSSWVGSAGGARPPCRRCMRCSSGALLRRETEQPALLPPIRAALDGLLVVFDAAQLQMPPDSFDSCVVARGNQVSAGVCLVEQTGYKHAERVELA